MYSYSRDCTVEKVAQSLIKGLILTFEASCCFNVLFIIKMDSGSIKVHACQGHTRIQYYIYKAVFVIAKEIIEKKLWLQSLVITCGT